MSAALELKRGYRLIEARDKPGGLAETVEEEGYRFDRTGHLLHLRDPRIKRLVSDLLDETPLRITRESRIFSYGVYTPYPFQAHTFGLPPQVVAECLTGFVKTMTSGAPKRRPDTFEAFIHAHFGAGIAKHFMIPYNTKLWGVHPREITADWCRRFIPLPTVEEVIGGAVGLGRKEMGYNARFYYPAQGIGALSEALADRVGEIAFKCRPKAIDHKQRRLRVGGKWIDYRALISTIPLPALIGLLTDPPRRIIEAGQRLRCTSLRYLDVALARPVGQPYHWIYVPERKYPFYRVGCYSNFSAAMAPAGCANLYVELSSRGPVNLDRLMPNVIRGLKELELITGKADIAFVRPRVMKHAYVIYDPAHEKSVRALHRWLAQRRIFVAGRFGRWEYSAMEDAMRSGIDVAKKVKELN